MSEYRVIFKLANSKRKYATHNGKVLLWDEEDIRALKLNLIKYETFAITSDYQHFAFSAYELAEIPESKNNPNKGVSCGVSR